MQTDTDRTDLQTENTLLQQYIAELEHTLTETRRKYNQAQTLLQQFPGHQTASMNEPDAAQQDGVSQTSDDTTMESSTAGYKALEMLLTESYERLNLMVQHMPALLMAFDANATIILWNAECERVTGYRAQDIVGNREALTLLLPDPTYREQVIQQGFGLQGDIRNWEIQFTARDGQVKTIALSNISRQVSIPGWAAWSIGLDVTERKRTEKALQESEEKYRMLFSYEQDAISLFDADTGQLLDANLAWQQLYGYSLDEALTMYAFEVSTEPDTTRQTFQQAAATTDIHIPLQWHKNKSGHVFPVEMSSGVFQWRGRNVMCAIIRDITERKQAEEALYAANQELKLWVSELEQHNREATLLNAMGEQLQRCLTLEEAYRVVERFAIHLFEGQSGALYIFNPSVNQLEQAATWGEQPPGEQVFAPEACYALQRQRPYSVEKPGIAKPCSHTHLSDPFPRVCVPLVSQDGVVGLLHLHNGPTISRQVRERWEWLAVMVGDHLVLALANLRLREQLQTQAIHDALTGLFNRRYLEEWLKREFHRASLQRHSVGIVMLDIDHFKQFNTVYGLGGGDATLRAVGTFLQNAIREDDIACRYGGEEFTLILPEASLDDTRKRANQVREDIKLLVPRHNEQMLGTITISVGVACYPVHGGTVDAVVEAASQALRIAKMEGRDRVEIASLPES